MADGTLAGQLDRLPAGGAQLLRSAARLALARAAAPYLVGGSVRDLLLGRPAVDLDVVVVGDAVAVAADLAAETGAALRTHARFGTATLNWPDGRQLDLITARHERYPAPGALPAVTPGTLDDDLRRRDFTINAIAISLALEAFGRPVDPLGGRDDLARGLVRVLHDASFRDDPTRLLRAIRYAGRLGFALEPLTLRLLREAVAAGATATVSTDRLAHEFTRLLAEPAPAVTTMVDDLAGHRLLHRLHPELRWDAAVRRAFAALEPLWPLAAARDAHHGATPERWMMRLALLLAHLVPAAAGEVAAALHLPSAAVRLVEEVAYLAHHFEEAVFAETLAASTLGRLLDPYSPAALTILAALRSDDAAGARLRQYLTAVRPLVPTLTGDYLRALGVPPGPIYREALAALRDHKRDDPALTVDDERRFLQGWLERKQGA